MPPFALGGIAWWVGRLFPVLGAPVVAILLGLVVGQFAGRVLRHWFLAPNSTDACKAEAEKRNGAWLRDRLQEATNFAAPEGRGMNVEICPRRFQPVR